MDRRSAEEGDALIRAQGRGKGQGPGQRLGMVTGRGPQSMMRREGDRVEGRTKLWGLSWED